MQRKSFTAEFKSKVALEAIKEQKTINEIASEYGVFPNQVCTWKKELLEGIGAIFSDKRKKESASKEDIVPQLYQQIGQLKVEVDWLKKNLESKVEDRRCMIEKDNLQISISRQCELLNIPRSTLYYKNIEKNEEDIKIMNMIDEIYTKYPFYGRRKITKYLVKIKGLDINIKRVHRLMKNMSINAICPKKNLSKPNSLHKKYPYLLSGIDIVKRNQVWGTDITYIRLRNGFAYLCAVIDWYSRYVLSWKLSNTMENSFCIEALNEALIIDKPTIFNTDQGSQFTSYEFTNCLLQENIKISMDGKGRAFDNIFIEPSVPIMLETVTLKV